MELATRYYGYGIYKGIQLIFGSTYIIMGTSIARGSLARPISHLHLFNFLYIYVTP